MSLTLVGSLALDTIEAPAGRVEDVLGGTATYASIAASHFGRVDLIGVIGSDFPADGKALLERHDVDLQGVQVEDGLTFRWGGKYAPNFNDRETLFTELNVFEHFNPVLPEAYRKSDYLLLANIHPSLQHHVLNQFEERPFVALDTMNLWINTALDDLKALLKDIDLLMVNDEEALMLTGERHYGKAAQKLMDMGPGWIVIKKGSHGALLFFGDRVFSAPALILDQVIDPTGAGDSFAGGLMGYLARERSVEFGVVKRAVIYGSLMASFCVEDFSVGAMDDISSEAIEKRFQQFRELTQF